MKRLFLLGAGLLLSVSAFAAPEHFYLGTYTSHSTSQGIYSGTFDPDTGKLGPLVLAAKAADPSFLALSPDGRFLYAALGPDAAGSVGAYHVEPDGSLTPLNQESAGGAGTCYVAVNDSGRVLLAANYSSGNIASFPVGPDGQIGPAASTIQFQGSGPNKGRQSGPHAHSIYVTPDDEEAGKRMVGGPVFVYSCDLGTDRVWIFRLDPAKATLTPADPPFASVPPGAGPRHLAFAPDGRFVYVVNEMGSSVTIFKRDPATGALAMVDTVSCLPEGISPGPKITAAEIALDPSGRWLYASVRGYESIAVFSVDETGGLKLIQNIAPGVKQTRHFAIDPTGRWLITEGQADNHIAVLSLDPKTGQLSATAESATVGVPVCLIFDRK